jgi:hypothetical protein
LVRGTSTRQPNNGLVSNHDKVSRWFTTSPMTSTVGSASSAPAAAAAMRLRGATTVTWSVVVPADVSAAGVSGSRPAETTAAAMSSTQVAAPRTTRVW